MIIVYHVFVQTSNHIFMYEQFIIEIMYIYMFLNSCSMINTWVLYQYLHNYMHFVCNQQLTKSIPRILIILYDICILYLCHILQILRYSTRVTFSHSLQFLNYLPIIAPDYHPFVNRKGMHYLLIWIFLPNTYHFEIVLLPNTIPWNPTPFYEI